MEERLRSEKWKRYEEFLVQKKHMKLTENAAKAAAARLAPTIRNPSASRKAAATDSVKSDLWFA